MSLKKVICLGLALCLILAPGVHKTEAASTNCTNYKLADVERTYYNFPSDGTSDSYRPTAYSTTTDANHSQGIAKWGNYLLVSENVESAIDFYNTTTKQYEKSFTFSNLNLNGTELRHYSGCQQIGDYLAIGIETQGDEPNKSYVCFYDAQNNAEVGNLRITRPTSKAGGVGITNYNKDGNEHYLLAVYDDGPIDFYDTDKPLYDPACNFGTPICSFNLNNIEGYGEYSEICLVTDQNQNIYLMGFRSTTYDLFGQAVPHEDYIDLYSLDISGSTVNCKFIDARHLTTHHNESFLGVHFRYTGGLEIESPTKACIWTSERNPSDEFIINYFSSDVDCVTIYKGSSYRDRSQLLSAGKYNVSDLNIGNDALSSLKIPDGMIVTLYSDKDFQGSSKTFTSDTSYVGDDFNDRTSSIIVEPAVENIQR